MKTEHSWLFNRKLLLNVVNVCLALELGRIGALEARLESHLHLGHDFWADNNLEVSPVGASIPIISNVTTVHDLTIDVTEILVGHELVLAEVIVEYVAANGQITIVKRVESGPSLGTELPTAKNKGVEHDKTKDEGLEFVVLVFSGFLIVGFIEFAHGST